MPPIVLRVTGIAEIVQRLRGLGERYPEAAGDALFRWASSHIQKPAREEFVPVMHGTLRDSIEVLDPVVTRNTVVVTVAAGGAAAPYARDVHENPRSGRTGGVSPSGRRYKNYARVGQWKYLETPAIEAAYGKQAELAAECGAELEKVIRGLS